MNAPVTQFSLFFSFDPLLNFRNWWPTSQEPPLLANILPNSKHLPSWTSLQYDCKNNFKPNTVKKLKKPKRTINKGSPLNFASWTNSSKNAWLKTSEENQRFSNYSMGVQKASYSLKLALREDSRIKRWFLAHH